ncbi:MAG: heme exporter protein CcmD [Cellvibrionales bacterium]|tara:strand:- start:881 stop:1084 length:204 start_codon:yes stop_codon:yes gene_type:complete
MNIQFASFNEILAMGGHGVYVWLAVTVSVSVLVALLVVPWQSHTRALNRVRLRLKRHAGASVEEGVD